VDAKFEWKEEHWDIDSLILADFDSFKLASKRFREPIFVDLLSTLATNFRAN
jgi:hypothetical protein